MSDLEMQCAIARPVPRWRKLWRAALGAISWQLGSFYRLYVYRHHMRLIHPRSHWWTHLHPIGSPRMDWCQWCGERRVYCENVKREDQLIIR